MGEKEVVIVGGGIGGVPEGGSFLFLDLGSGYGAIYLKIIYQVDV